MIAIDRIGILLVSRIYLHKTVRIVATESRRAEGHGGRGGRSTNAIGATQKARIPGRAKRWRAYAATVASAARCVSGPASVRKSIKAEFKSSACVQPRQCGASL